MIRAPNIVLDNEKLEDVPPKWHDEVKEALES